MGFYGYLSPDKGDDTEGGVLDGVSDGLTYSIDEKFRIRRFCGVASIQSLPQSSWTDVKKWVLSFGPDKRPDAEVLSNK